MVFSSSIFLFGFLPLVLIGYFLLRVAGRSLSLQNGFLLLASLLFYSWGEQAYVLIMLTSIAINHVSAIGIDRVTAQYGRKTILVVAIVANLLLLGSFKYLDFVVESITPLLALLDLPLFTLEPTHLPIGISFFTFQALSYIIDVYRRTTVAETKVVNTALYISLFPQLIAGPIVRYVDIKDKLHSRHVSLIDFSEGVKRFTIGLGKKVLVANVLAQPVDAIFAVPGTELTTGIAWFGIICYSLQIYFDFSGYSDMAIGIGRMLGFHYNENFNYPYISKSIREFWRRWHISLSTWFRDYLYIPLGGNRGPAWRVYRNLILVFVLCGLWHGAAWTFVIWGLFHGIFLVIERGYFGRVMIATPKIIQHLYAGFVILNSWVLFRSDNIFIARDYFKAMYGISSTTGSAYSLNMFVNPLVLIAFLAGILFSAPIIPAFRSWIARPVLDVDHNEDIVRTGILSSLGVVVIGLILMVSMMRVAIGTYDPFIYFRF